MILLLQTLILIVRYKNVLELIIVNQVVSSFEVSDSFCVYVSLIMLYVQEDDEVHLQEDKEVKKPWFS